MKTLKTYNIAKQLPNVKTDRLCFKIIEMSDVDFIHQLYSDWKVSQHLGKVPFPFEYEDAIRTTSHCVAKETTENTMTLLIKKKDDSRTIGIVTLRKDGELGILGYSILPEFWNMGFATEAVERIITFGFEYLELSTIQASTTENNIASMKVLEKLGFSLRESGIKENSIHSGERLVKKYQIQRRINKRGIRLGVRAAIIRDDAILLVAFDDENGFHYNLPGGGVESSETLYDAVRREVREETAAEVEVKELLFVYECFPPDYGFSLDEKTHCVDFLFRCALCDGSEPRLPDNPDENEVAIHWIPLAKFPDTPLVPQIQGQVIAALRVKNDNLFLLNPDITDEVKSLR